MIYILLRSQSEHLAGSEATSNELGRKLGRMENSIFFSLIANTYLTACLLMSAVLKRLGEQLRQALKVYLFFSVISGW